MTDEQKAKKAETARKNGANSQGPKSAEGKAKSRRNAIKHGRNAKTLKHMVPPHPAVLCNEERQDYYVQMDELIARYQPTDEVAMTAVRQIASAHWQIHRLEAANTAMLNFNLLEQSAKPRTTHRDLLEMECSVSTICDTWDQYEKIQRQIDRLLNRIAKLEKQLINLKKHFPIAATEVKTSQQDREHFCPEEQPERTNAKVPQPIENKTPRPVIIQKSDDTPAVRDMYSKLCPGLPIVVVDDLPEDEAA